MSGDTMQEARLIEFSLQGLAGLLAAHGFRVVAGEEDEEKRHALLVRDNGGRPFGARVFKTRRITLTVALETPEKISEA